MELLNRTMCEHPDRPIRVLQFGEGNFLRGFADEMIDIANEQGIFNGNIVIVKPRKGGDLHKFHRQDCCYTVSLKGNTGGRAKVTDRIITSISDILSCDADHEKYMELADLDTLRFIISNTTEAGIVFDAADQFEARPAKSFPGKLTQFLYRRFLTFQGAADKGLIMLPVELIENNGSVLRECVTRYIDLWKLGKNFQDWIDDACIFASTLVDRIITGYPGDSEEKEWNRLGYIDRCQVTGEPFALWVIESPQDFRREFPLQDAGLPVIYTEDLAPYKQQKVRILNGAHTSLVPVSYLMGNDIVRDSINDPAVRDFMEKLIHQEVIPTLPLPKETLESFADAVTERFGNPYIDHSLLSISLNSISKWRARCLPSFLAYYETAKELPKYLTFSLAALMAFYTGTKIRENTLIGHRGTREYPIRDEEDVLEFFREFSQKTSLEFTKAFLSKEVFWGCDLSLIPQLTQTVSSDLEAIRRNGMREALCRIL